MLQIKRILKSALKYKTSSSLTILSLIISFFGILILTLYVSYEKSFDGFHKNEKQIYRLSTKLRGASVPAVFSTVLQENIPEVEFITPLCFGSGKVKTSEKGGSNTDFSASMLYARNSFFDIFTFPLQIGDRTTALTEANTVVISESFSQKLFGSGNPLGESIFIDEEPFKVTGVMKDIPKNSSFQADCVTSFATCFKDGRYGVKEWSEWSCNIFVKLRKGSNPEQVALKIEQTPILAERIKDMKNLFPSQSFIQLTPLEKVHFLTESNYESTNPLILNVLILLTVILIFMGAVNFINFSTSQAPLRSKALALLEVFGGKKLSSMGQIIAESVLLSLIALVIAFVIHQLSYPAIESLFNISGLSLSGRYIYIFWFFLFAVGFGILAGLYPSWYITSSPISQSVKGNAHFSGKGKTLKHVLITTQFIFAIVLLISAFIIEKQLNYWRNFDIGLNKEHVIYLRTTPKLQDHYNAFAAELMKNQSIVDYTYSGSIPGKVNNSWSREVDGQQIQVYSWPVDDRFIDFFGIKVTDGRKFALRSEADINTFILNKKAVEKFGWKNPLERKIDGVNFKGQIIGITDNFNFSSLKDEIKPMLFWMTDGRKNNLLLRIKPENFAETREYIQKTALKFDGENQIEVKFLDDILNKLYEKEESMRLFIEFISIWCMLLAVTGLLGLIIFICRDRIKEIGIRKVSGATVLEVMIMLNKDFVKWVVIAYIIAVPISWYAMNKWLESFTYKTELSWWIFALAGLIVLIIALLTVSWQSWRAATINPVDALRNE